MLGLGNTTPQLYSIAPVYVDNHFITLNGTDEYIDCQDIGNSVSDWSDIHTEGTISIFAKFSTTSTTGTLVRLHKDSSNFISLYYHASSNTVRTSYRGDGSTTVAKSSYIVENTGFWHHIVSTWNASGQIKLYIDSVFREAKPGSGTVGTWDTTGGDIEDVHIGQNTLDSTFFKGSVNDFSLWKRELPLSDIQKIGLTTSPERTTELTTIGPLQPRDELIAYYKFEDIYSVSGGYTTTVRNHAARYAANTGLLVNTPAIGTHLNMGMIL